MFRRFMMAAIVAGIATLAGPALSKAAFTVTISDGVNPDLVFNSATNFLAGNGSLGDYDVQITATANSPGGSVSFLSNTAIAISATTPTPATTLTITAIIDGFTNIATGTGVNVFTTFSASTLQGTGEGFTTLNGSQVAGSLTQLPGPGQDDATTSTVIPSNPYTLGNTMILDLNAFNGIGSPQRANVNIDSSLTAVPAPAGLILAATALPFVGLLRRRLRRPEATTAA